MGKNILSGLRNTFRCMTKRLKIKGLFLERLFIVEWNLFRRCIVE